jgi:hypothetical protein
VWNLDSCRLTAELYDDSANVGHIAVAPDGDYALSGSDAGLIKIWHLARLQLHGSFHADAGVTALAAARHGVIVAGDRSGAVHILQCLSAVAKAEADRVLDAVERKIRHQISTFRGHVIANRTAGSVCQMAEASSGQSLFMIAFDIHNNCERIGIAVFAGDVVMNGLDLHEFVIRSADFNHKDELVAWYGEPAQVHYALWDKSEFSIYAAGGEERNAGYSTTERQVDECEIELHEPIDWPEYHGGSRTSIRLHGKVTSKTNWRRFLHRLEKRWVQIDVRGPCPWDW